MGKGIGYVYGEFTPEQMSEQKRYLHKSIHWLLLYKDPKTSGQWNNVDVDQYINSLLLRIGGLNGLFGCPPSIVTLMSVLQAARQENLKSIFDWKTYRKLVLDAQALVDTLPDECDEGR